MYPKFAFGFMKYGVTKMVGKGIIVFKLIKRNVVHQLMHAIILEIKNLVNFLFAVPFSCKVNLSSFFLRKQIKIYLHNLKNQTSNNKTVLQKKEKRTESNLAYHSISINNFNL